MYMYNRPRHVHMLLTPLVVNPFAMVGLLNCVTTISLISSMDGFGETYSSNGGRYCFMDAEGGQGEEREKKKRGDGRKPGRGGEKGESEGVKGKRVNRKQEPFKTQTVV